MLNIMIVEDEVFVRKSMMRAIETSGHDFHVVAEAQNGKQAFALFKQNEMDVILTDIAMPVMNGMEFIQKVREIDRSVKIIILSCLSDFSYVKSALENTVEDYFLKAETDPSELIEKLVTLEKEISAQKQEAHHLSAIKNKFQDFRHELNDKFFKDLLFGPPMSSTVIQNKLREFDLHLNCKSFFMACVTLDHHQKTMTENPEKYIELLNFSTLNVMRELLEKDTLGYIFKRSDGQYLVIGSNTGSMQDSAFFDTLSSCFRFFLEQMHIGLSCTHTIGISALHSGFNRLTEAFHQAVHANQHKFFAGTGRIIFFHETDPHCLCEAEISADKMETITLSLNSGDLDTCKRSVDIILHTLVMQHASENAIRNAVLRIASLMISKLTEMRCVLGHQVMSNIEISNTILQMDTYEGLHQWMKHYVDVVFAGMKHWCATRAQVSMTDSILHYMELNYTQSINLNGVANHFNMNPSYFSVWFKEKMGVNFIDYLTKKRIDKAMVLLGDASIEIQDIGVHVGYPNPQYFSRLFKKTTGMTPSEYRSQPVRPA